MFGSKKNKGSQESLNEAGGLEYENTPLNGEDAYGEYEDDYDYEDFYDSYGEDGYDDEYDDYDDYEDEQPRSLGHTIAYMAAVLIVSVVIAVCMWFAADDVLALTKPDNVVTITIEETILTAFPTVKPTVWRAICSPTPMSSMPMTIPSGSSTSSSRTLTQSLPIPCRRPFPSGTRTSVSGWRRKAASLRRRSKMPCLTPIRS